MLTAVIRQTIFADCCIKADTIFNEKYVETDLKAVGIRGKLFEVLKHVGIRQK